ncbi:hypothetical protein HY214_02190 [Candidatus Roizmanbacteria bacterium]|nr:hypothetical protein [Candidatus Roizmanbacteria bacterium]
MKNNIKNIIAICLLFLVFFNIYIFVSSIKIGASLNKAEKEIKKLELENKELEARSFEIDSLQYASSLAPQLQFTKESQALYIKEPNVALKP